MEELLNNYLNTLQTQGDQDEAYKWEAINHFQEVWDIEADDFKQMFENAFGQVHNLLYHSSRSYILTLLEHFPEEVRAMFKDLYKEETALEARIVAFQKAAKGLLPRAKEAIGADKLSTYQDERTISVYLVFRFPDKYFLYKASFYKKLCEYLNVPTEKAGRRFLHYLKLAEEVKEKYISHNEAVQQVHNEIYPDTTWDDDNLITQSFLFSVFEKTKPKTNKLPKLEGEEQLRQIIQSHDKQDIFDYFSFLDAIVERLNIQQEDVRVAINTSSRNLTLIIGQRYCWALIPAKRKKGKFSLITTDKIDDKSIPFDGEGAQPFYNDFDDFSFALKNQETAFDAMGKELSRTTKSGFSKYNNQAFRKAVFDKEYRNRFLETSTFDLTPPENMNTSDTKFPLNQILYGPPGTGKTYHTINYALEICGIKTDGLTRKEMKEKYKELVETGQIVFTTFHQSTAYEDFIEGIKPIEPEKEGNPIIYKVIDGTFKSLAVNAKTPSQRSFDESYNKLISFLSSDPETILELKTPTGKTFGISVNGNENLSLHTGENQKIQGTLTKEKLLKEINGANKYIGWKGYFNGVLDHLKSKYGYNKNINTSRKNYVLIIDEINRGNVSAIFGELITLIEEDKRIGEDEALTVTLPYSKEPFEVPSNLFIFGTMNTADRSVEALDTALRRRFSFKEMMPDPSLLEDIEFASFNLDEVLKTINERIEFLLDRDHTIGHSYFMNLESGDTDGLEAVFKNKVIPLLQEYFYHDYEKIALILGAGFVRVTTNHIIKFPIFQGIMEPDNVTLCELVDDIEDIEKAIIQLLNRNEE